jgi:hypothetical protein
MVTKAQKKEYYRNYKREKIKKGGCRECGRPRTIGNKQYCEEHYMKVISHMIYSNSSKWRHIQSVFHAQGCKCALTGVTLFLGTNASFDYRNDRWVVKKKKNQVNYKLAQAANRMRDAGPDLHKALASVIPLAQAWFNHLEATSGIDFEVAYTIMEANKVLLKAKKED